METNDLDQLGKLQMTHECCYLDLKLPNQGKIAGLFISHKTKRGIAVSRNIWITSQTGSRIIFLLLELT